SLRSPFRHDAPERSRSSAPTNSRRPSPPLPAIAGDGLGLYIPQQSYSGPRSLSAPGKRRAGKLRRYRPIGRRLSVMCVVTFVHISTAWITRTSAMGVRADSWPPLSLRAEALDKRWREILHGCLKISGMALLLSAESELTTRRQTARIMERRPRRHAQ
ncbi:hypothetical protein EI94DRAFT_1763150, partial [Lactarius quietus]